MEHRVFLACTPGSNATREPFRAPSQVPMLFCMDQHRETKNRGAVMEHRVFLACTPGSNATRQSFGALPQVPMPFGMDQHREAKQLLR